MIIIIFRIRQSLGGILWTGSDQEVFDQDPQRQMNDTSMMPNTREGVYEPQIPPCSSVLNSCQLSSSYSDGGSQLTRRHRMYQCPVCNKVLHHKNDFRKHYMVHTGEKPYACTICEYKTSRKADLRYHLVRKHGVIATEASYR